jgi:hypothetical protein
MGKVKWGGASVIRIGSRHAAGHLGAYGCAWLCADYALVDITRPLVMPEPEPWRAWQILTT